MHTWIRTDLLKDLESYFLRLNWPWFNGLLMRINPSMATLQLLGGDSMRAHFFKLPLLNCQRFGERKLVQVYWFVCHRRFI